MRAAVVDRYGAPEVVRVVEVPRPEPRAGEVLVRVRAVAVTAGDARIRAARFPAGFGVVGRLAVGLRGPRRPVLGGSFSGEVVAGEGFAPGEDVCGMAGVRLGAHAEYAAVPAAKLVRKPTGVSHEDAAGLLFGGSTALFFLRDKGSVKAGDKVLVNGASGAIGTNAVQLAKHFGAEVTAVTSARNAELVRSLGADHVLDYTTGALDRTTDRYDLVLDTVGTLSIKSGRRLLTDDGTLLLAVATLADTLRARGNVVAGVAPERPEAFAFLLDLVAKSALRVVVDDVHDLSDIVRAHHRVDSGRKVGNVIVRP
ncbi:NAD(P)-dependent alcohol dehydrogenase [Saccharothrix variisporea]|uniref:NADPH:quinone reductase-like Zn-dependent oxidoreductase n=1 Tax=Saccharothrix variisporea TaxID=543527 RepID=A0A495X7Z9_9PSEU|nr:NAD(P)-dependent alcohol dehydrogenase [Saccharothrix variisporea]RKT67658.1 NADPH:quinone reductase-like Zn-dependent oxidoreductase [Saccharothrix variisporea]